MKELAVTVELLEPYRVQLWYEKKSATVKNMPVGLVMCAFIKVRKLKGLSLISLALFFGQGFFLP